MESKHGGSPLSGVAEPAGLDSLRQIDGSKFYEPEIVKQNRDAKERARQFERRRIALEILPSIYASVPLPNDGTTEVDLALRHADELMEKTGGFITGAGRE